ncbi:zinc ribbon-containing protein [Halorhodospira halochloris]|uniref:zinc ribbon-containing protein n=1 Tax=Halorhodospira halochloris TaxID=1052 RepID=UPI001EE7E7AC|nr:zinc ribbon-containing protein [Halorhodospira halochloris]MCG5529625.1 zinc ribbon-containing protein [Halorhodospira halochloris]MCG5548096.1 zinc ribbon-containing protein [Halorhodospira halochloris]
MSNPEAENQDRLSQGYELLLDRVRKIFAEAEEHVPSLSEALSHAKQECINNGELTHEEANQVEHYLRRDAEEAGAWLAQSSDDDPHLGDWLRMDLQMLESWLWEAFSSIADRTKLELQGFTTTGEPSVYHSGEVAGPGTLQCFSCGRELSFSRPEAIPKCPGCDHEEFIRTGYGDFED